jgi:hypothetical protein
VTKTLSNEFGMLCFNRFEAHALIQKAKNGVGMDHGSD